MKILEIENLLQQVSAKIIEHEEEKVKSKESFNFFKVLGITRKETYHSKFIAELLNPNGLHGCGDIFLKAFWQVVPAFNSFNINHKLGDYVKIEEDMGEIKDNPPKGGRADIAIRTNGHLILIENKIYAGEQEKQMIRYHYHKNKNHDNCDSCILLYLTITGSSPSPYSCGKFEKDKHYYCISYEEHIVKWLEKCIRLSKEYLIIQETIKGYLTVINFLTNQTSYHTMQKKIKNVLLENPDYLGAAQEINNVLKEIEYESSIKIKRIYDIVNENNYLSKSIEKEIIVSDFGNNEFNINIPNEDGTPNTINIEMDATCYAVSDLFKTERRDFIVKEPFTAEEFVNAMIVELNKKFE